ncbi:MAG: nucleotidyl transferase AbiEii/AbiGii toxin family protein [Mycoplasmataceae bacterium]|nr:nucleotidyl transferase AbiEii/AbiGii toxin family protein [Mycoplasmataceae bacterium]
MIKIFHLDQENFKQFLNKISTESKIDADILEKDYYICCILKDLAGKQEELKAYFKGGTAIYKILDEMKRFSEDIDLTVKERLDGESRTHASNRLENSALSYQINGLRLNKEKTERIGEKSRTAYYEYESAFEISSDPLDKAGFIQVETTSFTVSEPYEIYTIEPLIYKFASEREKEILKEKYNISSFEIKIIKLERMFVDKIFAAEFFFVKNKLFDTCKHLYDIAVLFENERIQELLKNKKEMSNLITLKRDEELNRKGSVDSNIKLKDYTYFKFEFDSKMEAEFNRMQRKYIYKDEYKLKLSDVKEVLEKLVEILNKYDF